MRKNIYKRINKKKRIINNKKTFFNYGKKR